MSMSPEPWESSDGCNLSEQERQWADWYEREWEDEQETQDCVFDIIHEQLVLAQDTTKRRDERSTS